MKLEKVDICFIILHYKDIELTDKTVQSILRLEGNHNSRVIIVDNASPNGSGKQLEKKYHNNLMVKIVLSDINGGFSRGNNLGYQYCLDHYDMDFVIAANNDVIFSQKDFIPVLYECYEQEKFYVAGPDIFVPHRQYHQSPIVNHVRDISEMRESIELVRENVKRFSKKIPLKLFRNYCIEVYRENILIQKLIRIAKKVKVQKNVSWKEARRNVVLFGACIIFSKEYCMRNDELFETITFMYGEEDFLALKCVRDGGTTMYLPQLRILHIGHGSSISNRLSFAEFRKRKIEHELKTVEAYELYIKHYMSIR